jgi:hypothetical protein
LSTDTSSATLSRPPLAAPPKTLQLKDAAAVNGTPLRCTPLSTTGFASGALAGFGVRHPVPARLRTSRVQHCGLWIARAATPPPVNASGVRMEQHEAPPPHPRLALLSPTRAHFIMPGWSFAEVELTLRLCSVLSSHHALFKCECIPFGPGGENCATGTRAFIPPLHAVLARARDRRRRNQIGERYNGVTVDVVADSINATEPIPGVTAICCQLRKYTIDLG